MKSMHINLNALHLNQLLLVEALLLNTSLSEAAEHNGMSQSAASHALARLRKELKDPIFMRTAEGMKPTPYGTRLARSVSEALDTLRAGLERYEEFLPETSTRTFIIIMSEVSQMLYLPKLLARLAKDAPSVLLQIMPVPAKTPHLILESGDADLAVGTFTHFIAGCRQKRIYRDRYTCIARADHPLFEEGMTAEAFGIVSHVIVDSTGYVHEQLDRILGHYKMPRNTKLRVPGFQAVPMVVADSDIMAIMAGRLAQLYAELLPLKIMAPPVTLPTYDVMMFWHERFHRDPTSLWLRNLFFELFAD